MEDSRSGEGQEGALLRVDDVHMRFGGISALDGVTFNVASHEVCALIGPNGAGKTTMFNCVSGLYRPDRGRIAFAGTDLTRTPPHRLAALGLARTFQNVALFPALSVLENVMLGATPQLPDRFVRTSLGDPRIRRENRRIRQESLDLLERLELGHLAESRVDALPFGTLKRVELARCLAARPKMVMLDEPANGLSHSEVHALAQFVRRLREDLGLTVLLIEHHMGMVMDISDKLVVLNFGKKIAEGSPDHVREDPEVVSAYLGASA